MIFYNRVRFCSTLSKFTGLSVVTTDVTTNQYHQTTALYNIMPTHIHTRFVSHAETTLVHSTKQSSSSIVYYRRVSHTTHTHTSFHAVHLLRERKGKQCFECGCAYKTHTSKWYLRPQRPLCQFFLSAHFVHVQERNATFAFQNVHKCLRNALQ